jgi:protein tyrosine phosphatase (PTP) superfamily phosphohydrolase (DUF442 family)
MKNEAVIDGITVGGQPTEEELKSGRFASVINVRGADEEGNDTGAILAGSDVAYTAVPWTVDTVTNEDIAKVRAAVDASDGPVLIHCMLAMRAATAASIVSAEKDGSGGVFLEVSDALRAGFVADGTPYEAVVNNYFK